MNVDDLINILESKGDIEDIATVTIEKSKYSDNYVLILTNHIQGTITEIEVNKDV